MIDSTSLQSAAASPQTSSVEPIGNARAGDGAPHPIGNATAEARDPKLWAASKDFESIFVRQLLATMRSAGPGESIDEEEDSSARGIYEEMLDSAVADNVASTGTLGIAAAVYRQMSRLGGANP